MRARLAILVCTSACGVVQAPSTPDAPPEPVVHCTADQPFRAPTLVGELSTSARETDIRLTRDELGAYVSRGDPANGTNPPTTQILVATRATRQEAFGSLELLALDTPDAVSDAIVSSDAMSLYVTLQSLPLPLNSIARLGIAHRNTPTGQFDPPVDMGPLNQTEPNPSDPNGLDEQPYIVPSGAIWFSSNRNDPNLTGNLWHAEPLGLGFAPPVELVELSTVDSEQFPVVSDDERTIYFARAVNGALDIMVATRASTDVPFDPARPVDELNTTVGDRPSWLSPDGCRLYFTSARDGGAGLFDVWEAEKQSDL